MKPYYEHAGITIYHGDCREILPGLEYDCVLTDPPYGMGYSSGWAKSLVAKSPAWSDVYGPRADGSIEEDDTTDARNEAFRLIGHAPAICFGRYGIEPPFDPACVLIWDKGMAAGMGDLHTRWRPNWEMIFVSPGEFRGGRDSGVLRHNNISRLSMGRCHPHMKPVSLLRYLADKCPPGTILDPFMGSGTTLRAAKDLGRKAIGIEIEERYCEIAANRLSQEVLPF